MLKPQDNAIIAQIITAICSYHKSPQSRLVDASLFGDKSAEGADGCGSTDSIFTVFYYLLMDALFCKSASKSDPYKLYLDKLFKLSEQFRLEDGK